MPTLPAQRTTLADVAAAAGVSVSTASLAFSGSGPIADRTRDRVLEAARTLGYAGPNPLGRQLRNRGIPIVLVEGTPQPDVAAVGIDDRGGMAELTRHVVGLGHTRIATVTLPFDRDRAEGAADGSRLAQIGWEITRRRLRGVTDAGVDPVVVWETPASLVEHGAEAGRALLARDDRPTAVLCQSDLLASGVVLAARELGLRVPEDVSVAGFDGLDLPWLAPDVLTSVSQPLADKGAAIGDAVADLLAGRTAEDRVLPVSLRVGTTTGPPPA